jgi:hypothetical protein
MTTGAMAKPDDPAVRKAVFVARKRFAELVYDIQALETCVFRDGSKRTGLLMLNGGYLSHGALPLSIPAARLLEYNTSMSAFHESGDHAAMLRFMLSCHDATYPGHAGRW